jgi:hypothetical protein
MTTQARVITRNETNSVRLHADAIGEAAVAAATRGLSLVEYASGVLLAAARRENDQWSKARAR